jgi:AcrR family transcriptional regulator
MATQAERSAATRTKILTSARALFITVGYEATTTAMILTASGVSRGAMYYHFESKESIFEELYVETGHAAMARSKAGPEAGLSSRERLLEHCMAWLKEASRPDVAAILLDLGPAVLGRRRCLELDEEHGLAVGEELLREAVEDGEVTVFSMELSARILRAAVAEAALVLLGAGTRAPDLEDVRATLAKLIS